MPYLVAGGTCTVIGISLVIGGMILFSRRRKRYFSQHQSRAAGQPGAIQDRQGNWWYQDPKTGGWSFWNGQAWQIVQVTAASPSLPMPSGPFKSTSRIGSWVLTLIVAGLVALLIFGVISLVRFDLIPGQSIQPEQNILVTDIFKVGGGGLLLGLLGFLLLRGGIKSILTRHVVVEDEWGKGVTKRGCSAVLTGISQSFFGLLLLIAGSGLMALSLYQQVLPWLGIVLVL
jgi:hypothetical protein